MRGFIDFIREKGVVGLAIGFMLGGAVSKLVASLVTDVIQPLVGMIFGSPEGLYSLSFGSLQYGKFLAALIDFVIISAVIYFGFKILKLEKLDKKKS